jgi:predicted amidohydrolase YtcJ
LHGIYAAAERKTVNGKPEGGWVPQERISRELALRAYTVNNAYAAGMEDEKGRVQPGMLADLTVLSADITDPSTDLLETEVLYTIVDGEIVYASGGNSE